MMTVATVCDGIAECSRREDEPSSCIRSDSNRYLLLSVGTILIIYTTLRFHSRLNGKTRKDKRLSASIMLEIVKTNETDMSREKLNTLLLHVSKHYGRKTKQKIGLRVYALEEKYFKNEAEIFRQIHNSYDKESASLIINAKFPGIVAKHMKILLVIADYLSKFEWISVMLHNMRKVSILIAQFVDLTKDLYLLILLIQINGGLGTLIYFPLKFTSIIIFSLTITIVGPLLTSSISLAINNPGLIFNSDKKDWVSLTLMRIGAILASAFNPTLLRKA